MKKIFAAGAIAIALLVSACSGAKDEPKPAPKKETAAATKSKSPNAPMTPAEVKAFSDSFEKAMGDIPPELREDFQKVFNCEAAKNSKLPPEKQRNIDAKAVREITDALKKDRSIANCS